MSRHEDGWCPVTCPLDELDAEIARSNDDSELSERLRFLEGVRHARIIIRAATGGRVGR